MTYAEYAAQIGRDDEHLVYEEQTISQYEDGSLFESIDRKTYTAEEVITLITANDLYFTPPYGDEQFVRNLNRDLLSNAKKAVSNE